VVSHPDAVGTTIKLVVPVSDPFDQLHKKMIPAEIEVLTPLEIRWFRTLENRGLVVLEDGKTFLQFEAFIDPKLVKPSDLDGGDYSAILVDSLKSYLFRQQREGISKFFADDAPEILKEFVKVRPGIIGQTAKVRVPVSKFFDLLHKGEIPKITNPRFASAEQIGWFQSLVRKGVVRTPFSWELFLNSDSRFPEQAGLAGAIVGSFYTLLVCFLVSFPMAIAAAVYLEEFAPKNRATDIIEVNINNLAAVPSVVFGLLGLAVFLNLFGLPRSAPLVGGMVLSLMTLPTIIIATRAALKGVPPSIREAALGVGASRHQVTLHHVLPLAMPGILTGTIIGLAQALGETAPLLLIGMNAFITSPPGGILEPATALPTQIFSWADSPERGFVSRTSAAILVLLGFLVMMNAIAIILRQRFERKW